MIFERARAIADAVLLEGYLLYPYRASSTKNQFRWGFGVLSPREWSEAGGCEPWWMETQTLLASEEDTLLEGRLRFLHIQDRQLEKAGEGGFYSVDVLEVGGRQLMPWDEGQVREIDFHVKIRAASGPQSRQIPFEIPGGEDIEEVFDVSGTHSGRVKRVRRPIHGSMRISTEPAGTDPSLLRLTIRIENLTRWDRPDAPRDEVLRAACLSTHLLLRSTAGSFISLLDPPDWAENAAAACKNVRAFPVLAGEPGRNDLVLAAPIILYDHAKIAPESPGDLFDATEIDEILSLRTLTLTDAEKAEAGATDPRAAAILERTERLQPEDWVRLHGTLRDLHEDEMVPRPTAPPAVAAVAPFPPGSKVRLRPGPRRTDAQDLLFAGRIATVEKVMQDIEGRDHLAVTLDDDPAAEMHRWYGRFHYYALDEVEAIAAREEGEG